MLYHNHTVRLKELNKLLGWYYDQAAAHASAALVEKELLSLKAQLMATCNSIENDDAQVGEDEIVKIYERKDELLSRFKDGNKFVIEKFLQSFHNL